MGYRIDSDLVDLLLGERFYFISPVQQEQGFPEFHVFSLSPSHRMVCRVDEKSSFHHHHHSRTSEPTIRFQIGGLSYQWETRYNILDIFYSQLEAEPTVTELELTPIPLYSDLGSARASLLQFSHPTLPSYPTLISSPNINGAFPPTPSVADIDGVLTGGQLLLATGYTGLSHDHTSNRLTEYPTANLQLQVAGSRSNTKSRCIAKVRRLEMFKSHSPGASRTKLAHKCRICHLPLINEANEASHMNLAHTCKGCRLVGSVPFIKAHRNSCPYLATSGHRMEKHRRIKPFVQHDAVPPPSFQLF